jgi:flagellar FliL protein
MLGKLIPAILALFGLVAGAGAGLFLRPSAPHSEAKAEDGAHEEAPAHGEALAHGEPSADSGEPDHGTEAPAGDGLGGEAKDSHAAPAEKGDKPTHDYVKLNNQFVVPVVQNGRVAALVILSISLEVTAGTSEKVYQVEPKLRDGFLQVMFDHANAGGFMGTFTDGSNMILLREALREVAQSTLGADVSDVLIVDIVRQDN